METTSSRLVATALLATTAVSPGGASVTSNEAGVEVRLIVPPAGLVAQAGSDQVALRWEPVSDATLYNLKRATNPAGPFETVLANIIRSVCTDTRLPAGGTCHYVVSCVKNGREVADSEPITVVVPPSAPTGLAAVEEKRAVRVNWSAATGATEYTLKRAHNAEGPNVVVNKQAGDATAFTGASGWWTYYYVLSSGNAGGESAASAPVRVKLSDWIGRGFH